MVSVPIEPPGASVPPAPMLTSPITVPCPDSVPPVTPTVPVSDAADPAASLTGTVGVTGGTLSGHGTVIGDVSIGAGGTLAPGGSIGTLTIQGNLVFAAAASYMVEI